MKFHNSLYRALAFFLPLVVFSVACPAATAKTGDWIAVLKSPDTSIENKAQACRQIGELGTAEAVPALASLLDHDVLNTYARAGLERIQDPSARAALRDALSKLTGKNLIGVINSLGVLRDAMAVDALQAFIKHENMAVAQTALRALGNIANRQSTEIVLKHLESERSEIRQEAATGCLLAAEKLMSQGSNRAAQAIYDRVRSSDIPISWRCGATRGAILSRQNDRIPFWIDQLHSENAQIRNVSLLTVRDIPSDALASALNSETQKAKGDLQIQLIAAIRDCHNDPSSALLSGLLNSANHAVRLAAVDAFSRICKPAESPNLVGVLTRHPASPEADLAWQRLARMNHTGIDSALINALSSDDATGARISIIRLLGERKTKAAADILIREAGGKDAQVSIAAYQALKPIAGSDEIGSLISQTSHHRDERVREAAELALFDACRNSSSESAAADKVHKALDSAATASEIKSFSRVLSLLGYSPALDSVAAGLNHADSEIVTATIRYLGTWPGPEPISKLFSVVESNAEAGIRKRALLSAVQLATAAADRKNADPRTIADWFERAGRSATSLQEKRKLISGLGRLHHVDAIRLLMNYADEPELKTEAAFALVAACTPMIQGTDSNTVLAALDKVSDVQNNDLQKQVGRLRSQAK